MNLRDVSFHGPAIDDRDILGELPIELSNLLQEHNGFVQFGGGLHVRGACLAPEWHSLRAAMYGPDAFHELYEEVDETDIPFAQDCSGDQFLIRGGEVHQLAAEVGEIDPLDIDLVGFLGRCQDDPIETLCMHPLMQYRDDGQSLSPGQLLLAYPPFCTGQGGSSASLRAVNAAEVISFHADLARQIVDLDDGDQFTISMS